MISLSLFFLNNLNINYFNKFLFDNSLFNNLLNYDLLNTILPFQRPLWIFLSIIFIIIFLLIIKKDFLKNINPNKKKSVYRVYLISRILIILALSFALATPYYTEIKEEAGNPHVTLLIDNSTSMKVMDTSFIPDLENSLKKEMPVKKIYFSSNLGDAILDNLEDNSNLLLISDGQINKGVSLDKALFYASKLNSSVSAIFLKELFHDSSIYISAPDNIVEGNNIPIKIIITSTNDELTNVRVILDNQILFEGPRLPGIITLNKELSKGTHLLEAEILDDDYFSENNHFYKVINVLKKPKLLFLTSHKNSGLEFFLKELYDVDKKSSIPNDINDYYAIVGYDVKASLFNNINQLHNFLIDEKGGYYGNGLVLFGGYNSFDRGNYKNSPLESLLPVRVGKGKPKRGNDNIVIILDISGGSSGERYIKDCDANNNCHWKKVVDKVSAADIAKAQAVNLISSDKNILSNNKVAVIAFGIQGTINDREKEGHYTAGRTIGVVEPLDYLYSNRNRLKEKIPRLKGGGPSELSLALKTAFNILKNANGQKYILLLTDGIVGDSIKQETINIVSSLNSMGVKTYVYGVARDEKNVDVDFLKKIAYYGDGLFDGPVFSELNIRPAKISIKWGDPESKDFGDDFVLIPFSLTHFITRGLTLNAHLNAFNEVIPKDASQVLVMTDFGMPALTIWPYGNGRVATVTVFSGDGLGSLLSGSNSLLISRTINWAIGDPQRKEPFFITVNDARINEPAVLKIKSKKPLSLSNVDFVKEGNYYSTTFIPNTTGFKEFMGYKYSVNYNKELQRIGFNKELNNTLMIATGILFNPENTKDIITYLKTISKKRVIKNKPLLWPFIAFIIIIYLLEAFYRRINTTKNPF